jgi:phospholipase D1/2
MMMTMSDTTHGGPILAPGRNCWRLEQAGRVAFLVDGADYFSAVRAAARKARRSIFILGWDIDSRLRLVPEGANDGLPEPLGDFLNALAKRSRKLRIYILDWDFAMVYAPDREVLPRYKLGWRTHRRVRFELDGAHPVGSSHHQKVVVIDDAMAFVGGLDLTHCRWDTPEHRADEPRRNHPGGESCPPFHDIQVAVDGEAAAALGELARERWRRATGKAPKVHSPGGAADPWPESLAADLDDVQVGIARTLPKYDGLEEVQEIKALYLDVIAAARHALYLENQYFSAASIADALARRLAEAEGPEVALVSRSDDNTWLEEVSIGVMRARLHRRLSDSAPADRYGSFCPQVPDLGEGFLNVHSKLLIADDEFVTVGSANLNNRSMGFDSECNLAIEAHGQERVRRAIRALRHRLLAEHLGKDKDVVAAKERETGSLLKTVEALRGGERSLEPLNPQVPDSMDALVPPGDVIDPEQPIEAKRLIAKMVPSEVQASLVGRVLVIGGLLALFLGLAGAWRWTELGEWLSPGRLRELGELLRQMPASPLLVLGAFVVGTLLVVPVTGMIAATVLVFGPWLGVAYSFAGALLGAAVTYGLGRAAGRRTVRRIAGSRLDRLSRELGRRGILAVATVRIVPVAPFTVINLVAGTTHINLRDFLIGTVIGLAPGITAAALFIDRILAALRDPGPGTFGVLAGLSALLVAGMALLRRSLRRRRAGQAKDTSGE